MSKFLKRVTSLLVALAFAAGLLPGFNNIPDAGAAGTLNALSEVIQLVTGEEHTVVLMSDQSVWAWGRNQYGQLGDNTTYTRSIPVEVIPSKGIGGATVTSLVAGANHTLAVLSNGKVMAWGNNKNGQLGDSTTANRLTPVEVTIGGSPFKVDPWDPTSEEPNISAGHAHTMAIRDDGYLYGWGMNNYGQLGNGGNGNKINPTLVKFIPDEEGEPQPQPATTLVAAGYNHTLALAGGTLYAFGCNTSGQLGIGDLINRNKPMEVTGISSADALRSGNAHSMVISGGSLYGWGSNAFGQINLNSDALAITEPSEMLDGATVTDVQGGYYHSVMLMSDSSVFTMGFNSRGQLGNGVAELHASSKEVVVTNPDYEVEFDPENPPENPDDANIKLTARQVSAGYYFSGVVDEDGHLWMWGENGYGQLGDATYIPRILPNLLPSKIFYEKVVTVNQVKLSSDKMTVGIGWNNGLALTSTIMPDNALYDTLTWTVSNPDIVEITNITPTADASATSLTQTVWVCGNKKAGTAVITATAYNGKKASCTVIVRPTAEVVNITSKPSKMLEIGPKGTWKMKAEVLPNSTYTKDVYWSLAQDLDDGSVLPEERELENDTAVINDNGEFRAKAIGSAYVRAQSVMDPEVFTIFEVRCGYYATSTSIYLEDYSSNPYQNTVKEITLYVDMRNPEAPEFDSKQIFAVNQPYGLAAEDIEWKMTPETVCSIDEDGVITAKKPGKANLIAKPKDGSNVFAKLVVNVVPIGEFVQLLSPEVSVDPEDGRSTLSVKKTVKVNFRGRVMPTSAEQKIIWSVENEMPKGTSSRVGTITTAGTFTGVAEGSCEVVGTCYIAKTDDPSDPNSARTPTEIRIFVNVIDPVTKIVVTPSTLVLTDGDTYDDMSAFVYPQSATIQEVKWSSSNEQAVIVDEEDGSITAVGPGTAKIFATAIDGTGKKGSSTVTVMSSPSSITLNYYSYTLNAGNTLSLKASVIPTTALQNVKWVVDDASDPGVATISDKGTVKVFGTGTFIVRAVAVADEEVYSDPCVITCKVPIKSISVKPSAAIVTIDGEKDFAVTINPANATDQNISYISSDPRITVDTNADGYVQLTSGMAKVRVEDGIRAGGPYTLTFNCGGKTAAIKLTVKDAPQVASITSLGDGGMIWKGKTIAFKAIVEPITADQAVTWYSSNEDVAKFDSKGNLRGVSTGDFEVYCETVTPGTDGMPVRSDPISLSCEIPVSSIKSSTTKTLTLIAGGEEAIVDIAVSPVDAYNAENWKVKTRYEDIVRLEQTADTLSIFPEMAGTETITVSLGDKSCTIKVTVLNEPSTVDITTVPRASGTSLLKGKTVTLRAKVYDIGGNSKSVSQTVTWESSDESIAKVNSKTGAVSVTGKGTVFIRCYALDAQGNEVWSHQEGDGYAIETDVPLTGILVSPRTITLDMDVQTTFSSSELDRFELKPIPEAYLGKSSIKWKASSSNKKVAEVTIDDTETGEFTITAVGSGKCNITIKAGDSTTGIKSVVITVNVKATPPAP